MLRTLISTLVALNGAAAAYAQAVAGPPLAIHTRGLEYGPPVVNNRGLVAFWTRIARPHTPVAIIVGTGRADGLQGIATGAYHPDELLPSLSKRLSINEAGQVAYWRQAASKESITRWSTDGAVVIASTDDGFAYFGRTGPTGPLLSMNDLGQVAFEAKVSPQEDVIYVGDGNSLVPVIAAGSTTDATTPLIDNDGRVWFYRLGAGTLTGIHWVDPFNSTQGADLLAVQVASIVETSLTVNNEGAAYVVGELAPQAGLAVVHLSTGLVATAAYGAPSYYNHNAVSHTDLGATAFSADGRDGNGVYFVSSCSGEVVPVVTAGDVVQGKIVATVHFSREGASDVAGTTLDRNVAAAVDFEDSSAGVYLWHVRDCAPRGSNGAQKQ